ncbi:BrxA family protein [Candidatus Accumulibacter meliphilus]|jgi:hypothetical protein
MAIYNAEISAGSLMLPESRRIARLLLTQPTHVQWLAALKLDNLLQKKDPGDGPPPGAVDPQTPRYAGGGRVDADCHRFARGRDAAVVRGSDQAQPHLADFVLDVYAGKLRRLEQNLSPGKDWEGFLAECVQRDPELANLSASTKAKVLQVILRVLAEGHYVDSTRTLRLTPPHLNPDVVSYLKRHGETRSACHHGHEQMSHGLNERLNQLLPRLTSPGRVGQSRAPAARSASGSSTIRPRTKWPCGLSSRRSSCRHWPGISRRSGSTAVNLFDLVIGLLEERKLLDKVIEMQRTQGDARTLESLRRVLKEDKLARRLVAQHDIAELDLLILWNVGAAYPMLRTHTLLSALHAHMKDKPLVMFYPGKYDGYSYASSAA